MVMDQGNFHIVDNDFKFTITWELAHLPKSTESHLDQSVDFISGLNFWSRTYFESPQNFPSIAVLHIFLASL